MTLNELHTLWCNRLESWEGDFFENYKKEAETLIQCINDLETLELDKEDDIKRITQTLVR